MDADAQTGLERPDPVPTGNGLSEITLVVTSCGRFDLLERTLASMCPWLEKISNRIIVEDSGENPVLFDRLREEGYTILVNGSNLGQHESIDRAYAEVRTNYIFHCEDDWEFTKRPNFEGAKSILDNGIAGHDRISSVCFRDHVPNRWRWKTSHETEICGSSYRYSLQQATRWNFFTFNPGLFRRDLHDVTGPYASFLSEGSIARFLRKKGYIVVKEVPGAVQHIGEGRGTPRRSKTIRGMFRQWLERGV